MATTAICNRKTTATSSPRPHTPQHHGIGATPWHQEQPSPSPARFISIADFSPTRIQTRKPAWSTVTNPLRGNLVPADHICCPTWQHLHFTTDLPQLTAFTSPFSRPGATRFSPHDRHAKPCLRSDWARREADPNRPPGLLPMRPIRTWPKPCMGNRLRGNPVHNATIYHLSWQYPRRVTEKPQLAGRCRGHEGCTPQGRHEAPAAAPPESVHLPICPWTLVGTPGAHRSEIEARQLLPLRTTGLRASRLPPHVAADALAHHNSTPSHDPHEWIVSLQPC